MDGSVKSFQWLALGLSIMLSGCWFSHLQPIGDPHDPPAKGEPGDARALALEPGHAELYLAADGDEPGLYPSTIRFSVRDIRGGEASTRTDALTWESSAPEIAEVDDLGHVRAIATGSVLLTVRANDEVALEATASVTVKDGGRVDVLIE